MPSDRQLAANRRNAQLSTGPRTPAGKAASSQNALKTGIDAKSLLVKGEKLADLELLIAEHYHDHSPVTAEARALVDEVVRCEWTLRRLSRAETQLWEYDRTAHHRDSKLALGETALCTSSSFTRLQWRIDSTRRALFRTLNALRDLKPPAADAPSGPEITPSEPLTAPPPIDPTPSLTTTSPTESARRIGFVPQPAPTPTAPPAGPASTASKPAWNPPSAPATLELIHSPGGKA